LRTIQSSTPRLTQADWTAIGACPLFSHLNSDLRQRICNRGRIVACERGHIIFNQGDVADAFFVLLDGWVKLYRLTANGGEAVVTVLTTGETFAEPVMFLGGRYPVAAEAASACRLLRMELTGFIAVLEEDPDVAAAMLASIARHGTNLTEQIERLKLLDAPRRVAEFFLRLIAPGEHSAQITLPYEKALIAARLGMTPESFSRALASLGKYGVVVQREVVTIGDVGGLRGFAALD
jgi:CRP-like cAMP-binding protein